MRIKDRPDSCAPIVRMAVVMSLLVTMLACGALAVMPTGAVAAVSDGGGETAHPSESGEEAGSLESAATKAGETGRKVAMSLLGLALAVAAIVLAFRRDFKEAAGVFVVGVIAVLLATPAGLNLIKDTVTSLFGS